VSAFIADVYMCVDFTGTDGRADKESKDDCFKEYGVQRCPGGRCGYE